MRWWFAKVVAIHYGRKIRILFRSQFEWMSQAQNKRRTSVIVREIKTNNVARGAIIVISPPELCRKLKVFINQFEFSNENVIIVATTSTIARSKWTTVRWWQWTAINTKANMSLLAVRESKQSDRFFSVSSLDFLGWPLRFWVLDALFLHALKLHIMRSSQQRRRNFFGACEAYGPRSYTRTSCTPRTRAILAHSGSLLACASVWVFMGRVQVYITVSGFSRTEWNPTKWLSSTWKRSQRTNKWSE